MLTPLPSHYHLGKNCSPLIGHNFPFVCNWTCDKICNLDFMRVSRLNQWNIEEENSVMRILKKKKKDRGNLIKLSGESSQNDKAKHITIGFFFYFRVFRSVIFYILATLQKIVYYDSNFSNIDLKIICSSKV